MKRFAHSNQAWTGVTRQVKSLIASGAVRRVLEVGGGANPLLQLPAVEELGLEYTVLDISQVELDKAAPGYIKLLGDIGDPALDLPGGYDLVFSRMLAEHVRDGETFHRNVLRLLAPGGRAFHFFPTLYSPPFVLNRLLPERLAQAILDRLEPGRHEGGKHAKFPAYYSWCRGPTDQQFRRFEALGYRVDEYIGYFGHDGYYRHVPGVRELHRAWSNWLVAHPLPALTSFAYLTLSRPPASAVGDTASTAGRRERNSPHDPE
jgi:SAM-dependent methyltransferase